MKAAELKEGKTSPRDPSQFRFLLRQGLENAEEEKAFSSIVHAPLSSLSLSSSSSSSCSVFVTIYGILEHRHPRTLHFEKRSRPSVFTYDRRLPRSACRFSSSTDIPISEPSSGRRIAARDSRAGEEDWTKRKKQNKTSKAEEAEEHKSKRRAKARRVEAGLRRE
ncbi:uncharacterized protein LOC128896477 [Hylaeus anthracinus]|uniref:uncharacterized protein LOC128896477 n=1 Tax=Hylaeus anthracinus TaxID=313031 RepID=UPI0023B97285|nr:uncharacterized protein LOC128896477 [Hylaeus anthracinus]